MPPPHCTGVEAESRVATPRLQQHSWIRCLLSLLTPEPQEHTCRAQGWGACALPLQPPWEQICLNSLRKCEKFNVLVVICTIVLQNAYHWEKMDESAPNPSILFLTTAWEATIISKKNFNKKTVRGLSKWHEIIYPIRQCLLLCLTHQTTLWNNREI